MSATVRALQLRGAQAGLPRLEVQLMLCALLAVSYTHLTLPTIYSV